MTEELTNEPGPISYVDETGLALLHQGDQVVAREDAQAALSTRAGGHTAYHFPINVVVMGDLEEDTKSEIENRIWAKLNAALT